MDESKDSENLKKMTGVKYCGRAGLAGGNDSNPCSYQRLFNNISERETHNYTLYCTILYTILYYTIHYTILYCTLYTIHAPITVYSTTSPGQKHTTLYKEQDGRS